MQLKVLADADGGLHVQISSPSLVYGRHLFVPMLPNTSPLLRGVNQMILVDVWSGGKRFKVPYLLIHSESIDSKGWKNRGSIDENDSRNILNQILDILAWD
jgi:hypothetical protein